MKKIYEKPAVEVVDVELESLMITNSNETAEEGVGDGEAQEGDQLSKEHNGFWE